MAASQLAILEAATRIGKPMNFRDKGGTKRNAWGKVVDEVYIMVDDYKHLIQRIQYADDRRPPDGSLFGYRTGYYTLDSTGTRVKWGQFAQHLTEIQYRELLGKAKARGWPIF